MTYLTKNVYDVIKQRSLFGFEERKKEVNYMDAKVFGKFIMERRKQLGMTQAELAEKIRQSADGKEDLVFQTLIR